MNGTNNLHKRESGGTKPLATPSRTPPRKGLGGGHSNGIRSNRHMGVAAPSRLQHSTNKPPNNVPLIVFRIIVIAIIIFCLLWGYLILKIASEINEPGGGPVTSMLARPRINAPGGKASIGWMIRQKMNAIEMQLQSVPLLDVSNMDSPILVITAKRADYLERTLWRIFENHPAQRAQRNNNNGGYNGDLRGTKGKFDRIVGAPIIITQDGKNAEVQKVIETYRQLFEMKLGVPLCRIEHPPANIKSDLDYDEYDWAVPYKKLAVHYGWALNQTFSGVAYSNQRHKRQIPKPPPPKRVIILEEDIEISDDFFSLMNATADLLDKDDTLLAVSAFNDNGKEQFVADTKRLVRSDFFPGLGWMMSRTVWDGPASHPNTGLKFEWAPGGFWDDWLRENARRWGRQIIRPEVSRTFHFGGVGGASDGVNNNILNKIELEERDIHFEDQDLSYLDASSFADTYWNRVSRAKLVTTVVEAKSHVAHSDVRLTYPNYNKLRLLATELDVMDDEKAGVPRTGYEGIVEIRYGRGNYFIYLTPPYVTTGGDKPEHFGRKAWKEYSKESLMKELGIEDAVVEDRLDLDWDMAGGWGNW